MTVNHAADVAEAEGSAESVSAQAGVFDAEAAQEAAARRESRPAAAQPVEQAIEQPVAQPVEAKAKPQEHAPAAAEEAPVARTIEAEPFELKAQTPEPATFDLFAKPASAAIENPFGPTSKVAETTTADPFASAATEESKPVEAAQRVETAPEPAEPVAAESAEAAEPAKTAAVAPTPEATIVEPVKPVESTQAQAPVAEQAPVAVVAEPVKSAAPAAPATSTPIAVETLQPMLERAGLVWVNTDEGKLREANAAAAREPAAVRVPRERKALPPADTTPMQQVETSKHVH
jgi:ribonuclease E